MQAEAPESVFYFIRHSPVPGGPAAGRAVSTEHGNADVEALVQVSAQRTAP